MDLTQYLEIYISKQDFNSKMPTPVGKVVNTPVGAPDWLRQYMADKWGMKLQHFKEYMKRNGSKVRKYKVIPGEDQRLVLTINGVYYTSMGMSLTHSMLIDQMVYDGIFKVDQATFNYDDFDRWWDDGNDELICLIVLRDYPGYVFLSESYKYNAVENIQDEFTSGGLQKIKGHLLKLGLKLVPTQVFDYDPEAPTPKQLIKKYYPKI